GDHRGRISDVSRRPAQVGEHVGQEGADGSGCDEGVQVLPLQAALLARTGKPSLGTAHPYAATLGAAGVQGSESGAPNTSVRPIATAVSTAPASTGLPDTADVTRRVRNGE